MQLNLSLIPSDSTPVAKSFSFQHIPERNDPVKPGHHIVIWFRDLAEICRYRDDDIDSRNRMIYTLVEGNHISQRRVADALGLSPSLIKQVIKQMRAAEGLVIPRRTRGSGRVLTDILVAELNVELSKGRQLTELAQAHGICLSTLRKGVSRGVLIHPLPHPERTLSCFGGALASSNLTPDTRGERASVDHRFSRF